MEEEISSTFQLSGKRKFYYSFAAVKITFEIFCLLRNTQESQTQESQIQKFNSQFRM
jgi:hypothetical protein